MAAVGGNLFPPRRRNDFDEWFNSPVAYTSPDPNIEVRRAQPSEFDRIYDLVDETFGFKRSRALNDWVYRDNPHGPARCWVLVERATGEFIGALTDWPWPVAHGPCLVPGAQNGDAVLLPRCRQQGIYLFATHARLSHPWIDSTICYGWPNAASVQRLRKNYPTMLIGPLPSRVLPLQAGPFLARRGLPRAAAGVAGRMLDALFASWSTLVLRRPFDGRLEQIRRFDSAFDEVTRRCMLWEGYWSPHDAEFLNWRYLRDPVREHLAFALEVGSRLTAYSVVRVEPERAQLMEFAVPPEQPMVARALLLHTIKAAAAAGCSHLVVAAAPRWRHWQVLRTAGFMSSASTLFMFARSHRDDTPGVQELENWQLLGGDLDPLYD